MLSSKSLFYMLTFGVLFTNSWLCPSLDMADPGDTLHWLNRDSDSLSGDSLSPRARANPEHSRSCRLGSDHQGAFGFGALMGEVRWYVERCVGDRKAKRDS